MKRSFLLLLTLLAFAGVAMTGCSTTSVSQSPETMELQKPVERLCDIHDTAVVADPKLSAGERASALADSAVLRNAFLTSDVYLPPAVAPGKRVCARHDPYVLSDPNMSPVAKKVALKRSEMLVEMLDNVKMPRLPVPPAPPTSKPTTLPSLDVTKSVCPGGNCSAPR